MDQRASTLSHSMPALPTYLASMRSSPHHGEEDASDSKKTYTVGNIISLPRHFFFFTDLRYYISWILYLNSFFFVHITGDQLYILTNMLI